MRWASLAILVCACGRIGFDPVSGDATLAAGPANVVFVTSSLHVGGMLGSLAAADAICAQRAGEAGRSGTFVAWLSSSTVDARDRVGSARGWVRPDGRMFADTIDDIVAGKIYWPPRLDERGNDVASSSFAPEPILTGTNGDGTSAGTCQDYTSVTDLTTLGDALSTTVSFTSSLSQSNCSAATRLLCFQIDYAVPVVVTPEVGRIAFASGNWDPATGLTGADSQCQAEASAASLPGSYGALLATTSATAASRFDQAGAPWVRTDGVQLSATPLEFMQAKADAPLNVAADGVTYLSTYASTGYAGGTAVATDLPAPNSTCVDWTTASGREGIGYLSSSGRYAIDVGSNIMCDGTLAIYCLQR